VIQEKKPGVYVMRKEGQGYAAPALFFETKDQPLDVTSEGEGRIFVSQRSDSGLTVLSPDGKVLGQSSKWEGQSLVGLVGLSPDRGGSLICTTGERGPLLRVPISALTKIGEK